MIKTKKIDILTTNRRLDKIISVQLKSDRRLGSNLRVVNVSDYAKRHPRREVSTVLMSRIHELTPRLWSEVALKRSKFAAGLFLQESGAESSGIERLDALGILRKFRDWHVHPTNPRHPDEVFIRRVLRIWSDGQRKDSILDAQHYHGELLIVSGELQKLVVPTEELSPLAGKPEKILANFEIDEDGSYLYWPDLDVHLGWEQFQQAVDPMAALKARQKSERFNKRYGEAIRSLREDSVLRQQDIAGLDERQVRRVEQGQCRATASALEKFARAHRMNLKDYLNELARRL